MKKIGILLLVVFFGCNSKVDNANAVLFSLMDSKDTNVHFSNNISEGYNNFFGVFNYAYNGAGVAVGDINNDGLDDIYFTGNQVSDKLYLNKGNFIFEDITQKAGILKKESWHNGVVMADVNADGLLDIYVCRGGWKEDKSRRANLLYINKGNSKFEEQAALFGLNDSGFSMMASFFDADNDNDLDVYVTNRPNQFFLKEEIVLKMKRSSKNAFRDKLYINNNGKFELQDYNKGLKENFGYGLGLVTADLNDDNLADVYVGNDFYENDYFYANKGMGEFEQSVQKITNHLSFYTMGVDVVDFNNDGFEDIFTLDMLPSDYVRSKTTMAPMDVKTYEGQLKKGFYNQYMHNVLNLNNGNGFFSDVSQLAGVSNTDWSWSCLGADFDNDGDNDLLVTNGYKRDVWNNDADLKRKIFENKLTAKDAKNPDLTIKKIIDFYPSVKISNRIYENKGKLNFVDKAPEWGLGQLSFSNGAAYSDFDNDGDLDLVINNIDDKAFLYKNNSNDLLGNNYLKIKLNGPKGNNSGLGAKITVYNNNKIQYKEVKTVRGYLSSVTPTIHFGLGNKKKIDSLSIVWSDGKIQKIKQLKINTQVVFDYNNAKKIEPNKEKNKTWFNEITDQVFIEKITHVENDYDDYKKQILLPHKLSSEGPAIAVSDVDGDGLQDFYLGGSHKFLGRLFRQTKSGFEEINQLLFGKDAFCEDVFAEFTDIDDDGDMDLYVVSGGNEFYESSEFYQDRLYLNNGKGQFNKKIKLPSVKFPGSKVLFKDFDNDGDKDIFIFGRHKPGKYPSPQNSMIIKNENNKFIDVTDLYAKPFNNLGMVKDAIFADIDGDDKEELLVVGEWMKVTVFKLNGDRLIDISNNCGLSDTEGWWNVIKAADLDDDGDLDFVLGNLGLNYKYKASIDKPFYVFASDYDNNGTQDVFLAKPYKNKIVPIRGKECSTQQLPNLKEKFKTYNQFANADIFQIIGSDKSNIKHQAKRFESVILKNEGGKFNIEKLPVEAQFSTINSLLVYDYNNDGIKDILFAGNRFDVEVETTRSDQSIGGILKGVDNREYDFINTNESGIFLPGDIKYIRNIICKGQKAFLVVDNKGFLKMFRQN